MRHFYVDRKGIIVLSLNSILLCKKCKKYKKHKNKKNTLAPAISTKKQSRVKAKKSKNAKNDSKMKKYFEMVWGPFHPDPPPPLV